MTSDDYPYWTHEEIRDTDREYDEYLRRLEEKHRLVRRDEVDPYEYVSWEAGL